MNYEIGEPLQTFELKINLRTYAHSVSPMELPNLIKAAIEGDGTSCLFHASAWTPMVTGHKYKGTDLPECPICYEKIKKNQLVATTPCNHLYHKTCMTNWFRRSSILFKPSCPSCRALIPVKYKFHRAAEVLSRSHLDNDGTVYIERTLVPQSGKHHNELIYATRV